MQIRKEIRPMLMLVLFCATVVIAAGYASTPSPEPPVCMVKTTPAKPFPCKTMPKEHHNSPWEFITRGILHFTA